MRRRTRFTLSLLCILIAIVCLNKGMDLWTLSGIGQRDGSAIFFLGVEIKQVVSNVYLKDYAKCFLIIGAALLGIAIFLVWKPWKESKQKRFSDCNIRKER